MANPRAHTHRDTAGSRKAETTMESGAEEVADRLTGAAQAQVDSGTRIVSETVNLASNNLEAADAVAQTVTHTLDTTIREMADRSRQSLAEAQSALRAMVEARTPIELFRAQADFSRSQIEGVTGQFSALAKLAFETASEVGGACCESMARTAEAYTSALRR